MRWLFASTVLLSVWLGYWAGTLKPGFQVYEITLKQNGKYYAAGNIYQLTTVRKVAHKSYSAAR